MFRLQTYCAETTHWSSGGARSDPGSSLPPAPAQRPGRRYGCPARPYLGRLKGQAHALPRGFFVTTMGQLPHRAFGDAHGAAGDVLDVCLGLLRIQHPGAIELERAVGHALVAIARGMYAAVATVQQLEQMVLRLVIGARIADL